MGTVSIREARKHLSQLVDAAQRGESVTITRRGKQVARLGPVEPEGGRGLPDLTEFRASVKIKGRSLTEELLAQRREERS